jgi:hypothetical protein
MIGVMKHAAVGERVFVVSFDAAEAWVAAQDKSERLENRQSSDTYI